MARAAWLAAFPIALIAIALAGSPSAAAAGTQHYEYVFPDGSISVYDMDNGHALVKTINNIPDTAGVRGVGVVPSTHTLYISYGNDGNYGNCGGAGGHLLAYDLVHDSVLWTRNYSHCIDSFAISKDGTKIYMTGGELCNCSTWYVEDASTGNDTGATISGGLDPHNTVVGLSGKYVYLGGRQDNHLQQASTTTNKVTQQMGPLTNTERPFTINGSETLAFTTATGFLGFQVSSITTGNVLFTVPVKGFNTCCTPASAPSHGISLSPNEKEIYVIDAINSYVHVFDVSGLPGNAPTQVADVKLNHPLSGSEPQSVCAYDCLKDGWVQHSLDGRFLYVGDSGDVVSTSSRSVIAYLPAMNNSRKMLEVDWSGGVPVATSTRTGLGYVLTAPSSTPRPTPTPPPTPTATATATPTPHPSPSGTATPHPSGSPTASPSASGSPRASSSPGHTPSPGSSAGGPRGITSPGSHPGAPAGGASSPPSPATDPGPLGGVIGYIALPVLLGLAILAGIWRWTLPQRSRG